MIHPQPVLCEGVLGEDALVQQTHQLVHCNRKRARQDARAGEVDSMLQKRMDLVDTMGILCSDAGFLNTRAAAIFK